MVDVMQKERQFDIILFDLDGTLIEFPPDEFVGIYLGSAADFFKDIVTNPKVFVQEILKSTEVMEMANNPETTTLEDFISDFCPKFPHLTCHQIQERFEQFYQTKFENIRPIIKPNKEAQALLQRIRVELPELKVVLATNPVFPYIAVKRRMEWGGLNESYFDYITHAENSHFCKPNLRYWTEILDKFNIPPEKGLVVGNDAYRDLLASKVGLKTFLIDNFVENEKESQISPDWRGNYQDLAKLLFNQH